MTSQEPSRATCLTQKAIYSPSQSVSQARHARCAAARHSLANGTVVPGARRARSRAQQQARAGRAHTAAGAGFGLRHCGSQSQPSAVHLIDTRAGRGGGRAALAVPPTARASPTKATGIHVWLPRPSSGGCQRRRRRHRGRRQPSPSTTSSRASAAAVVYRRPRSPPPSLEELKKPSRGGRTRRACGGHEDGRVPVAE